MASVKISVLWGLTAKKIPLEVAPGSTVQSLCELLAIRQKVDATDVKLLAAEGSETLPDEQVLDLEKNTEFRALVQKQPKLYLTKNEGLETTRKLADKMSRTSWHGTLDEESQVVTEGSKIQPLGEPLRDDVQAKAKAIQEAIEGIWLPGCESDFQGYSFVVDPGSEPDLRTALYKAFGFEEAYKGHCDFKEMTWTKNFSRDDDSDEEEDEEEEEEGDAGSISERLKKATEILTGFGKAYELNWDDEVICGPILYVTQNEEDRLVLGVVGGRVWT